MIKSMLLEHNHAVGSTEFNRYASNRKPTPEMLQDANLLVQHGANVALITHYMNSNGANVTTKDIYNIKQKLRFKGL